MRTILFSVLVLSYLFFGCGEEEAKKEATPSSIAEFSVTGMVCEMGCGGAIRKGLYETNAVTRVDVDFDEDSEENIVSVYFDDGMTSIEEITKTIESLNDNQFKAVHKSTSAIKTSAVCAREKRCNKKGAEKEGIIEVKQSYFSLPNLTSLLSGLIY